MDEYNFDDYVSLVNSMITIWDSTDFLQQIQKDLYRCNYPFITKIRIRFSIHGTVDEIKNKIQLLRLICRYKYINTIILSSSNNMTIEILQLVKNILTECNNIKCVDLTDNNMNLDSALQICDIIKSCSSITTIILTRCRIVGTGFKKLMKILENSNSLEKIIMPFCLEYNNNENKKIFKMLQNAKNLKHLRLPDISVNEMRLVLDLLKYNSNLQYVEIFTKHDFSSELAEVIKYNSTIKILDISHCSSMINGVDKILDAITDNKTLEQFIFNGYSSRLCGNSACDFSKLFNNNHTLQLLNLNIVYLTNQQIKTFFNQIGNSNTLKKLYIDMQYINSSVTKEICRMVEKNNSLLNLSMHSCKIDIKNIISSLCYNNCITKLELVGANIDNHILCEIKNMLEINKSITSLNISHNNLKSDCTNTIRNIIETSKNLRSINISFNDFNNYDIINIAKSLLNNDTLRTIYLRRNLNDFRTELEVINILSNIYTLKKIVLGDFSDQYRCDKIINRNIIFDYNSRFRKTKCVMDN